MKRCPQCVQDLSTKENSTDFTLQMMRENVAALDKPSPSLTNFFLQSHRHNVQKWDNFAWKHNVMNETVSLLNEFEDLKWLKCLTHKKEVKHLLIQHVSSRILHVHCANINKEIKADRRRVRQAEYKTATIEPDEGLYEINLNDWRLLTGVKGKGLLAWVLSTGIL